MNLSIFKPNNTKKPNTVKLRFDHQIIHLGLQSYSVKCYTGVQNQKVKIPFKIVAVWVSFKLEGKLIFPTTE